MYRHEAKENPSDLLQQLIDATGSWLHYKYLCMGDPLFNESYLSHPVGTFLLSRFPDPYQVQAQYPHPAFKPCKKRRPVDFAVVTNESNLKLAIETKWLTLHQPSHALSRVFIGLVKLALLQCENAFFIMAGPSRAISQLLNGRDFLAAPGHLYNDTQKCGLLPVSKEPSCDRRCMVLPVAETIDSEYFMAAKKKFASVALPREIRVAALQPYTGLKGIPGFAFDVYGWQVWAMPDAEVIRSSN